MKRFHSPLTRVLRLRQQTERMVRLQVARTRSELDAADACVAAARISVERQVAELEVRLARPGASLVVQQANLAIQATEAIVLQLAEARTAAAERLKVAVDAYRVAQQERETVERAAERHRQEHRRGNARAAAVELQDWILRSKSSPIAADEEESEHA